MKKGEGPMRLPRMKVEKLLFRSDIANLVTTAGLVLLVVYILMSLPTTRLAN
jgi:hypothetical protein